MSPINTGSDTKLAMLGAVGLGAGLMYFLDPVDGNRRRALVRDKMVRMMNETRNAANVTTRDLGNRMSGVLAETAVLLRNEHVSDQVLHARVRAELGRVVSHPHTIKVTTIQGRVTLSGPILASEERAALKSVSAVPGVTEVENHLDRHEHADGVSELQGGRLRERRAELMNWAPSIRLLAGAAGGTLACYGARIRNLPGFVLGSLGLGLLARGLTNTQLKRLLPTAQ